MCRYGPGPSGVFPVMGEGFRFCGAAYSAAFLIRPAAEIFPVHLVDPGSGDFLPAMGMRPFYPLVRGGNGGFPLLRFPRVVRFMHGNAWAGNGGLWLRRIVQVPAADTDLRGFSRHGLIIMVSQAAGFSAIPALLEAILVFDGLIRGGPDPFMGVFPPLSADPACAAVPVVPFIPPLSADPACTAVPFMAFIPLLSAGPAPAAGPIMSRVAEFPAPGTSAPVPFVK